MLFGGEWSLYSGALIACENGSTMLKDSIAVMIKDWDPAGNLSKNKYRVVSVLKFTDVRGEAFNAYVCDCAESKPHFNRLTAYNSSLNESKADFLAREEKEYCIHREVIKCQQHQFYPDPDLAEPRSFIEMISQSTPFLCAVKLDNAKYGVIGQRQTSGRIYCISCQKDYCKHTNFFNESLKEEDIEIPELQPGFKDLNNVISNERIRFPLPNSSVRCIQLPSVLVPELKDGQCMHGNQWSDQNPVQKKWKCTHDDCPPLSGASFKERTYILEKGTRDLVKRFSQGGRHALTEEEFTDLVDRLGDSLPTLGLLITSISDNDYQAPEHYKRFLDEIAKSAPVCGLIQSPSRQVLDILEEISESNLDISSTTNLREFKILEEGCPVLLSCLCEITKKEPDLNEGLRRVIGDLAKVVETTFREKTRSEDDYPMPTEPDEPLCFFPNWPLLRGLPPYSLSSRAPKDEADACTKHKHGHPVLSPGILTLYCPHSICYGYRLMDSYESPRMPFQILMSRFQSPPSNIIYDNACKLHVYFLNREPCFVRKTRFLVDRFHWKNHTACSRSYDMREYSSNPLISSINSQVNEQQNSALAKLKASLSYMNLSNFNASLRIFLALRNRNYRNRAL